MFRRRSRFINQRLPLSLTAIVVILIYHSERQVHFSNEIVNSKLSAKAALVNDVKVRFNPFVSVADSGDQIMKAYTHNDFGLKNHQLPVKRILFWNDAYGSKDYGIGFGDAAFRELNCPIHKCYTTDNRTLIATEEFDAIVFHLRTFFKTDSPSVRRPHQRYVLWSIESPQYNMQDIFPLDGIFNWTFTYRMDSDVFQPYGWVEPTGIYSMQPKLKEIEPAMHAAANQPVASQKSKLIAWFVSNCQSKSKREDYVNALRKYVPVDVYGDCGDFRCDKHNVTGCYDMLDRDYKFYISFENSYCDDYVTEKLFSVLKLDVVPIVFGGANYSRMAPPFSYIDARNFRNARDLADYIKLLSANDYLYRQYSWWKAHYRVRNAADDLKLSMCGLCARLHVDTEPKVYRDVDKWWVRDSHCKEPRQDNVFRIPYWHH